MGSVGWIRGVDVDRPWTACSECREAKRYENAKKIKAGEWDGPVEFSEQFFSSVSEAQETIFDWLDGCEPPRYVYACETIKGFSLDAGVIEEGLLEEMEDGFEIDGIQEMYDFVEKWNKEQDQEWWRSTATLVLLDWDGYAMESGQ